MRGNNMHEHAQGMERLTVSLPVDLAKDMKALTRELGISKSEVARRAFDQFLRECRRQKLQQIAEEMAEEYRSNPELTAFTDLDGEAFK